ncbi:uncharacterized protein KY384_004083 [Bacidia gigantensis]|uniref:uncharacterized protein n=1 Tax=Bacidia gigantensis TaxID=2732470 RepID=UPI001D04E089|nr:uncharacterized protein KY384_004083 [Bacidia gigantensis]KAG8530726.1 hypothetical protein KY384_004083 [Bacidia gigantensis]
MPHRTIIPSSPIQEFPGYLSHLDTSTLRLLTVLSFHQVSLTPPAFNSTDCNNSQTNAGTTIQSHGLQSPPTDQPNTSLPIRRIAPRPLTVEIEFLDVPRMIVWVSHIFRGKRKLMKIHAGKWPQMCTFMHYLTQGYKKIQLDVLPLLRGVAQPSKYCDKKMLEIWNRSVSSANTVDPKMTCKMG